MGTQIIKPTSALWIPLLMIISNVTFSWNFSICFPIALPYSSNTLAPKSCFFSTISLIIIIYNSKIYTDLYNIRDFDFAGHLTFKDSDLYCISSILLFWTPNLIITKKHPAPFSWFRSSHTLTTPSFFRGFYFTTSKMKLFYAIKILKSFDHNTFSELIIYFLSSVFYSPN